MAMKPHLNEKGMSTVRGLSWLLVLLGVYAGYLYGIPYFNYNMIQKEISTLAENAHLYPNDEELRKEVLEKCESWNIPVKNWYDVKIDRRRTMIVIEFEYRVKLNFFDKYEPVLRFKVEAREPLKQK